MTKRTLSNLCLFSFFIISSDFHTTVYKINDANSQSATKIFEFIDTFGLWSLGTLKKNVVYHNFFLDLFCVAAPPLAPHLQHYNKYNQHILPWHLVSSCDVITATKLLTVLHTDVVPNIAWQLIISQQILQDVTIGVSHHISRCFLWTWFTI